MNPFDAIGLTRCWSLHSVDEGMDVLAVARTGVLADFWAPGVCHWILPDLKHDHLDAATLIALKCMPGLVCRVARPS
jgi:hypothetical protein